MTDATEEAVKKIDSQLECSICLETLKSPKLLPCLHIFCESPCLEKLVVQDRPDRQTLTCPKCRCHVTLPENGVAGLPTDFHAEGLFDIKNILEKASKNECENCNKAVASMYCKNCELFLCEDCKEKVHDHWKKNNEHEVLEISKVKADELTPKKKPIKCTKHSDMHTTIYCVTCCELICSKCIVRIHLGHDYDVVEDIFPTHKEELETSLKPLKEKLEQVDQALSAFDTKINEVNNKRAAIKEDIKKEIDKLRQVLNDRESELSTILNNLVDEKIRNLEKQKNDAEVLDTTLRSCVEYTEATLKTGTNSEVLQIKKPILNRIEELIAGFDSKILQPTIEANVELLTSDQASIACKQFGSVALCNSVIAENTYATGEGTKLAMENSHATVEVHPMTAENQLLCKQKFELTATLVHEKVRTSIECKVSQENGRHTITYQPASRGRHSLHVKVNDSHIQGSPYPVAVTSCCSKPAYVVSDLRKPWGIAVNSKRSLLISEHNRHCISVVTRQEGSQVSLTRFGTQGMGKGQLNNPRGITVDQDDNIYIVDNHRVQKFTFDGKYIAAVGVKGSNKLQFNQPVDVCYNKTDQLLYVCDQDNHRIQVLTTDLTFVSSFGTRGDKCGQFLNPRYIIFDSTNKLYVTDSGNNRVQIFRDHNGQYCKSLTSAANGRKLEKPHAIAIDSNDIVYVSELHKSSVNMYSEGECIRSFGEPGCGEGQFNEIRCICIDQDDYIIVSDSCNNSIHIL